MTKYFWYFSRGTPRADVVFSSKDLDLYGYVKEPSYEFIELYSLRFHGYGTLEEVAW